MEVHKLFPAIERESQSEIKKFQEQKLRDHLSYLNQYSPFYRNLFLKNKINIDKIRTIDDLQYIPVTTKDNLQSNNADFLCVDKSKIVDYITTSGTLGDPVTFALTDNDLDRLAYNEAISFFCSGGQKSDIYQLMTTIDRRFMAGLAYFLGVRKMGAGIVRVGNGIPELQWDTINRISPSAIIVVPSFILKIIEYAELNNIDFRNSSIKKAVCIGESLRKIDFSLNTLGKIIKDKWDIKLYSTYASTEMATAFPECDEGIGGHHHPELIIVEFLNENNKPVQEGEPGEITVTTLGVEGMPLLRFKTGDVCFHYNEPCNCGRKTLRIGPIIGRSKQMIKLKGTTLYPPALYDVLSNFEHVKNYIVEVFTNSIGTDEILIKIGCDYIPENFDKNIKDHFRAMLRVTPIIEILSSSEIYKLQNPEGARKPVKFIDKRD